MDKTHIELEAQYKIEVSNADYNWDYVDPFTNVIFSGNKKQAQMLAFMLTDQNPNENYTIKEVKPNGV